MRLPPAQQQQQLQSHRSRSSVVFTQTPAPSSLPEQGHGLSLPTLSSACVPLTPGQLGGRTSRGCPSPSGQTAGRHSPSGRAVLGSVPGCGQTRSRACKTPTRGSKPGRPMPSHVLWSERAPNMLPPAMKALLDHCFGTAGTHSGCPNPLLLATGPALPHHRPIPGGRTPKTPLQCSECEIRLGAPAKPHDAGGTGVSGDTCPLGAGLAGGGALC